MPRAEIIKKKKKVGSDADLFHSLRVALIVRSFSVFSSAAALRFSCD